MATFQDIENQMRQLREGDLVILKLIYKGHFRAIHGTVKDVGPVPSIVTDDGKVHIIRAVMMLDGKTYEFSSISKSEKAGGW